MSYPQPLTAAQSKAQDRAIMRVFWIVQLCIVVAAAVSGWWWALGLDAVAMLFVVASSKVRR